MARKISKTIIYTQIEAYEMLETQEGIATQQMNIPLSTGNLTQGQAERVVKKLYPDSTFKVTNLETHEEKYVMELDEFIKHASKVTE